MIKKRKTHTKLETTSWWHDNKARLEMLAFVNDALKTTQDASYPAALRSATTHVGTGGNPRVGPTVSFRRPPPFVFVPSPSPSNTCSPVCLSLNSSVRARYPHPYEDTSSSQASPALLSLKSEGHKPRRVRVLAASPSPLLSPVLCSSPLSLRPSVSWSLPLATVSVFSSSSSVVYPDKARQAEIKRQDKTRPARTQLISVPCAPLTPSHASFSSRFAHANAFACLNASSDSDSDSDDCLSTPPKPFHPSLAIDLCPFTHLAPLSPASPSLSFRVHFDSRGLPVSEPLPFSPTLSPITAPHLSGLPSAHSVLSALITPSPLIADSGCTGLLVQLANFPLLASCFSPKPLPLVPFTLPDGSTLEVLGGPHHITGSLTFPHKALPVSCYFLPASALSHSLFGVSPLIRPHGHAFSLTLLLLSLIPPPQSLPSSQAPRLSNQTFGTSQCHLLPHYPSPHHPCSSRSRPCPALASSPTGIAHSGLPPSPLLFVP